VIWEIARREIVTRGRTRAYKVITALLLVAAIAAPVASALWPDGGTDVRTVDVGLTEEAEEQFGADFEANASSVLSNDTNLVFDFEPIASVDDGSSDSDVGPSDIETALTDGDIDVVLDAAGQLTFEDDPDLEIEFVLRVAVDQQLQVAKADELGIDRDDVVELGVARSPEVRTLSQGDADDDDEEQVRVGIAFIGLFLAFLIPQVFGQLTMMGVIEEKATRVVEVLLGHVRPRTLLNGKLLGIGILAVVQVAIIGLGFLIAFLATSSISVPSAAWSFLPILVVSLIGGLVGYTTLFALLGSLISRQEDASQVMMPAFIPLMAGYIVGQTAAFGSADTLIVRILSFIPLTSSMLLPVRVARDAIEPWEIALSLALMILGSWLLLRLTAKIYELTILHTGSRIRLKDLRNRLA